MVRKFVSFFILVALLFLGLCTIQLSHSLEKTDMIMGHECCDFTETSHHETPEIAFLATTSSVLPMLFIVLVSLVFVFFQEDIRYEGPPWSNFLRRLNQGVLQLE